MKELIPLLMTVVIGAFPAIHHLETPLSYYVTPHRQVIRTTISPSLMRIELTGYVKIKNMAPKCSLYYGPNGEPLVVGEGLAQAGRNEIKPMSEKIVKANGTLTLICAPGQTFPVEIR